MRDLNVAGRDIKTVTTSPEEKKEGKLLQKIIKPLLVSIILALFCYVIFRITGVNLSEFKLR